MLRFLLDEHISPSICRHVRSIKPEIEIEAVVSWRDRALKGRDDLFLLRAAREMGYTLITYDQTTIRPLLSWLAEQKEDHGGIVFVSRKALDPAAFSPLAYAIISLWESAHDLDWRNRLDYLKRA